MIADGAPLLLSGEQLSLRRGDRDILARVDISVRRGEIVTVIGPNGAGKTTLLKILLGLIRPNAGTVIRHQPLKIGYLPQRLAIDPVLPLTVARLMTLTVRRGRDAVLAALDETSVGHLAQAAVQTLSGGELQRVLLARALLLEPDLLVLDEPVQGVDFAGEGALYALIARVRDHRDCGIIMVSHDLHMVMAATDSVLCLNRHVCCAGSAEAVGQHPEYIRLFGHRAAETLAVYTHHHDHVHNTSGEVVPIEESDPAVPIAAERRRGEAC